jgi:hypothetical protein
LHQVQGDPVEYATGQIFGLSHFAADLSLRQGHVKSQVKPTEKERTDQGRREQFEECISRVPTR